MRVAVGVVHVLEVVDVDDEHRGRHAVPVGVRRHPAELLDEAAAVEQTGQRVVIGEVAELALVALAVGDVLHLHHELVRAADTAERRNADLHPDVGATVADEPSLAVDDLGGPARELVELAHGEPAAARMHERPDQIAPAELVLRVPGQLAERRVHVVDPAHEPVTCRHERHADRRVREGRAEAALRRPQLVRRDLRGRLGPLSGSEQPRVLERLRDAIGELARQPEVVAIEAALGTERRQEHDAEGAPRCAQRHEHGRREGQRGQLVADLGARRRPAFEQLLRHRIEQDVRAHLQRRLARSRARDP